MIWVKMKSSVFFLLLFMPAITCAQSDLYISFEQFCQNVDTIFTPEQLTDLRTHLPEKFDIYGYDIGDFSGDEMPDIALSIRQKDLKGRKVKVFYLVSDSLKFTVAREKVLEFVDLPIEIGFSIEGGVCYTTQKKAKSSWKIEGYAWRDGNFMLVERYESTRKPLKPSNKGDVGYELTSNYRTLFTSEQYFNPGNNKPYFNTQYYTFPVYPLSLNIHPQVYYVVRDTAFKFIVSGAESFRGKQDAQFETAVFYDDSFLYFFAWVTDDSVEIAGNDWDKTDHVQLWFDLSTSGKVSETQTSAPNFRIVPDDSVFFVSIACTEHDTDPQRVRVTLRTEPTPVQQRLIRNIRVLSNVTRDGYAIRARIPIELFGGRSRCEQKIGYTMVLHDVDGTKDSARITELATSSFREWNPSTFGSLYLMKSSEYYGEVVDLNISELVRSLVDAGINAFD